MFSLLIKALLILLSFLADQPEFSQAAAEPTVSLAGCNDLNLS